MAKIKVKIFDIDQNKVMSVDPAYKEFLLKNNLNRFEDVEEVKEIETKKVKEIEKPEEIKAEKALVKGSGTKK